MRSFLSLSLYFICKLKILYSSIEYMLTVIAGKPKNPKTKKNIVGESRLEYVSKIHVQFIQHLLEVILSGENCSLY